MTERARNRAEAKPWSLHEVYRVLDAHHGPQGWWPARSRFEVIVGAVLTQNTSWRNVERAVANLRGAGKLEARAIAASDRAELSALLRPSGYFNVKARRLQAVAEWFVAAGGFRALDEVPTGPLRERLLAVHGVGAETADDILLYAFGRPVFVVDAYTRRLIGRACGLPADADYETLRARFERDLPVDAALYNQYHALIVRHAKEICTKKPRCPACVLAAGCLAATDGTPAS